MQKEIIIAGFGGQGVLFGGQVLAVAAMDAGQRGHLDPVLRSGDARRHGQLHGRHRRRGDRIAAGRASTAGDCAEPAFVRQVRGAAATGRHAGRQQVHGGPRGAAHGHQGADGPLQPDRRGSGQWQAGQHGGDRRPGERAAGTRRGRRWKRRSPITCRRATRICSPRTTRRFGGASQPHRHNDA